MSNATQTTATRRRPQGGPPPLIPAAAYGALMIAAVALSASGPRSTTSAQDALSYARDHTGQLQAAAVLTFAAALPLAVWTATIYRRLRTLGITAPGAVIGLVGGVLASGSLALSGLITWTLADTADSASPAVAHALVDLSFGTGAAGFVVPFALLIAGVAVPALILRLAARPLAWIGLVIAIAAILSTFTLATSALDPTLPIGRFGGLAWILAVSVLLPANRHQIKAAAHGGRVAAAA
jgi:hypothetical protein